MKQGLNQTKQWKNELGSIQILNKKKDLLMDELKTIGALEKRISTSASSEGDRSLLEIKRELNELKDTTAKNQSQRNTIKNDHKEHP